MNDEYANPLPPPPNPLNQPTNQLSAEQPVPSPQTTASPTPITIQSPVLPNPKPPTDSSSIRHLPPLKPPRRGGGIISLFATIIAALVLVQIINAFLFQSYKVVGQSMQATLHQDDFLIISKFDRTTARLQNKTYQPDRGDIIIFRSPIEEIQLVKRVIGLPGERVVVKNGQLKVYNQQQPDGFDPDKDTDYQQNLPDDTSGNVDITVPKGHVFVSGDNRVGGNSLDSRNELGTVPEKLIYGKLVVRIWPLNVARFF